MTSGLDQRSCRRGRYIFPRHRAPTDSASSGRPGPKTARYADTSLRTAVLTWSDAPIVNTLLASAICIAGCFGVAGSDRIGCRSSSCRIYPVAILGQQRLAVPCHSARPWRSDPCERPLRRRVRSAPKECRGPGSSLTASSPFVRRTRRRQVMASSRRRPAALLSYIVGFSGSARETNSHLSLMIKAALAMAKR